MVGQVMRALEAQVSFSFAVARRGAALAGQVTGWALTAIMREVLPDRGSNGGAGQFGAAGETTATVEQTATVEPEPRETEAEELTEPDEPSELTAREESFTAVPEPVAAPEESSRTAPGDDVPATIAGKQPEAAPIGGEEGAVVEHEPGVGTSVRDRSPHSALNNPVTEPDMTEWPDPYDKREDPLDPGEEMVFGGDAVHTQTGATSTSEPHPSQDPEVEAWEGPKRDKVDQ